jgi:hypothetical protein
MKILTTLLDIATDFPRLLQAEGKILRRAVMNAVWTLGFIGIASFLVLAASGFLLAGIYQYLSAQMLSPAAASILVTFPALVLALLFAGIVKWWTADPEMKCASVRARYPCA